MNAIPAQRTDSNDPQPAVTVTITIELRIQAQRAELHLDLTDDKIRELATHPAQPDVKR